MANYLITGGTSGIGKACAKELASRGNRLVIVGRDPQKIDETVREFGNDSFGIVYDLSDPENVSNIFDESISREIKFDGMLYSAGIDELCPIKAININATRRVMDVNCFSFVAMSRYFYSKRVSNEGASIVAISSLGSVLNEKGMVSYSMSKAAMNVAVKTMAKEFVKRKIRVNALLPGGVNSKMGEEKTELLRIVTSNNSEPKEDSSQPLGGISVEKIASMVCYLLGEEGSFFTGELIPMSAGREYNI